MRFCGLAILCAAFVAGCDASDQHSTALSPGLLWEFAGRDIDSLRPDEEAHLGGLLAALPPLSDPDGDGRWPDYFGARARGLWRHEWADGTPVVVVFQGRQFDDPSPAAVRFLDPAGRQLAAVPFYAGRGYSQTGEVAFGRDPTFGPVLELWLSSGPKVRDRGRQRQVYAMIGTRLALIRVEVGAGELVANGYVHPHSRIGPAPPSWTGAEWAAVLAGGDPAEVLAALVWLGGVHGVGGRPTDPGAEDEAAVQRVQAVRRDLRVRTEVRRLAQSEHQWVREAAKAAIARENE
jgi:hypothetical protein